jgi:hypothetical protein
MSDYQTLIDIVGGAILMVAGWFLRELWSAVKELQRDLNKLEANMPKEYVLKVDLDQRMKHIEDMFQWICDKLDNKADKP